MTILRRHRKSTGNLSSLLAEGLLPDLIQLQVRAIHGEWSAVSTAY
jgi:hypothetical protein